MEIGSAVYRESFLHWRESRQKLFHFKTIESSLWGTFTSFHYASAELFLRKINSIKVSFWKRCFSINIHTNINQPATLSGWKDEGTKVLMVFSSLPRGALIVVVSPHWNPVRPPPPPQPHPRYPLIPLAVNSWDLWSTMQGHWVIDKRRRLKCSFLASRGPAAFR